MAASLSERRGLESGPEDLSNRAKRSRRTLLLIFFVCLAPVVAGYVTFYFWRPVGRLNYGELLTPAQKLSWSDARSFENGIVETELRGKWVLLLVAPSSCDDACKQSLYYMRQVRITQAKEMDRIARAWIVTDAIAPDPAIVKDHAGLVVATDKAMVSKLVAEPANIGHIFLVDPLGNLMMRFPASPEPTGMVKDLGRLLKYSSLGER